MRNGGTDNYSHYVPGSRQNTSANYLDSPWHKQSDPYPSGFESHRNVERQKKPRLLTQTFIFHTKCNVNTVLHL